MQDLLREMSGMDRNTKLNVLRGLTKCIGVDGRATRPFLLMMAGGAVEVPQNEIVKCVLMISRQLGANI